jgi:hypothetical protein
MMFYLIWWGNARLGGSKINNHTVGHTSPSVAKA